MSTQLAVRLAARVGPLELDVEFEAGPGTLVVIGPNAAGKTSLLSVILGALPAARGSVHAGETALFDSELGINVPVEARRLGYVPQDYALFTHLSVRENVEFALRSGRMSVRARREQADERLRELGLEHHAERRVSSLSGGEKQRVALARALSIGPRALLLDEPLAALDLVSRREVRAFLRQSLAKLGLPALLVTHDPADARELGERMLVLEAGKIVQRGTWGELQRAPATTFVERFVS
jgi:molybdate transport system ATP-binding protein